MFYQFLKVNLTAQADTKSALALKYCKNLWVLYVQHKKGCSLGSAPSASIWGRLDMLFMTNLLMHFRRLIHITKETFNLKTG